MKWINDVRGVVAADWSDLAKDLEQLSVSS